MAKKITIAVTKKDGTQTEVTTAYDKTNVREFRNVEVRNKKGEVVNITSADYEKCWQDEYKRNITVLYLTDSLVDAIKQLAQDSVTVTIKTTEE